MLKLPFIHYFKDKTSLINSYYIALIPMLLFGFYKNGILLFTNNIITFKSLIIPLYFYIISIIISFIISKILKEDYKENILIALISISTISLNSNIIIFPILLFVTLFIIKVLKNKLKLTINWLSFIHLSLLLSLLINSYSYLNIGETLDIFNYNLFDIFLGHGVGGIANTSTLILIFSLIILSLNKFYKKNIPIASSTTFITINIIYIFLTKNYSHLNLLLNGTVYFVFIFIVPDFNSSPCHPISHIIYGILVGFVVGILAITFGLNEMIYIGILLISLLSPVIDKIINKKLYLAPKQ